MSGKSENILHNSYDVEKIRNDFPILKRLVNNQALVYFDNGATTQKPQQVIDAISHYYTNTNANIHRGVHTLSREATDAFEQARQIVAKHFSVKNPQQCIFTTGTTDGINMVAQGLAKCALQPGDEILLSTYEHHSNILPWQLWAKENAGRLNVIPVKNNQELNLELLESLITPKTKVIALAHVSNTLGVISDLNAILAVAQKHNLITVIDGAQSAPHMAVNLEALNVDFFVCSAHKLYAPTGIGMLYMSEKWLKELPITKTGGGTIKTVSFENTEYAEGALRFEPGTPHIAGAVGFGAALNYVNTFGMDAIYKHELALVKQAQEKLLELPEVTVYGQSQHKAGVISFNVKGAHPFDVGTLLDKYGVAVRTGHHCTQPLMQELNVPGTVRASFGIYNTAEEVNYFIEKLKRIITMLS
jgi:cysteine desulfurase / selenocysteine lyase